MNELHSIFLASIHYLSDEDRALVEDALDAAEQWHKGQTRASGEEYIMHPISVALRLTHLEAGAQVLAAALLHDVVEDGVATLADIGDRFGDTVATLVDGVTKLGRVAHEGDPSLRQVASLRKMLLVASEDIRVLTIKMADRLHNVETLGPLRPDKQQRIARETLDIYVPFSRTLGLWEWKREMEQVCFPIAFPEESKAWHDAIAEIRLGLQPERERFVEEFNRLTEKRVQPSLVTMTDYELFQRLYHDRERLTQTSQIDSIGIVIAESSDPRMCYRVLGEVHMRYPMRSLSFRDFINAPQPSGYRALHTTIFLSRNHELRLRIQTEDMHRFSMRRMVTAWKHRGGTDIMSALSSLSSTPFDRDQFITDVKNVVLERINVFTTGGEIIALPKGATGVDFAFFMNPDYLTSLKGVQVNGHPYEPTHELKGGDTVELLLFEGSDTALDRRVMWSEQVRLPGAKKAIKQELAELPEETQRKAGRSLLASEIGKWRLPLWWLFHRESTQRRFSAALGVPSFDEVLRRIGSGQLGVGKAAETYRSILEAPTFLQHILRFLGLLPRTRVQDKNALVMKLEVYANDVPGMIYNIAKCFADRHVNIADFTVFAMPPKDALYRIRCEVKNFDEFSQLFDTLVQVPNVKRVVRKA